MGVLRLSARADGDDGPSRQVHVGGTAGGDADIYDQLAVGDLPGDGNLTVR